MRIRICLALALAACVAVPTGARAVLIDPFYAGSYTFNDLGSVPGLPTNYGGLTFKPGDPNTIIIGGAANQAGGRLYEVGVTRDGSGHVTGFSGAPVPMGSIGEYNDGGVVYGPGGVLFLARWSINQIGQVKPGSLNEDRIDNGGAIGIPGDSSISALNFVPGGFGGAGRMKVVTYGGGSWYDVAYGPDGGGTYNLAATRIDLDPGAAGIQNLPGGPEGFVYIDAGNPLFGSDSMLVADYAAGRISAYEVGATGDPLLSTRRDFVTGLAGAEGAAIDPLTGDFLFSTFGGGNHLIVVQGFNVPVTVPVPGSLLLSGLGLFLLGFFFSRRAAS